MVGVVLLIIFPVLFVGICLWVIAAKVRVPIESADPDIAKFRALSFSVRGIY